MTNIVEISIKRVVSPPLLFPHSHYLASFIHTRFNFFIAYTRSQCPCISLSVLRSFMCSPLLLALLSGVSHAPRSYRRVTVDLHTRQYSFVAIYAPVYLYTQIQQNKLATKQILSKNKRREFILMWMWCCVPVCACMCGTFLRCFFNVLLIVSSIFFSFS